MSSSFSFWAIFLNRKLMWRQILTGLLLMRNSKQLHVICSLNHTLHRLSRLNTRKTQPSSSSLLASSKKHLNAMPLWILSSSSMVFKQDDSSSRLLSFCSFLTTMLAYFCSVIYKTFFSFLWAFVTFFFQGISDFIRDGGEDDLRANILGLSLLGGRTLILGTYSSLSFLPDFALLALFSGFSYEDSSTLGTGGKVSFELMEVGFWLGLLLRGDLRIADMSALNLESSLDRFLLISSIFYLRLTWPVKRELLLLIVVFFYFLRSFLFFFDSSCFFAGLVAFLSCVLLPFLMIFLLATFEPFFFCLAAETECLT